MATHDQAAHAAKAQDMWATFDKNEQTAVRFGMFPHDKMLAAEAEGYNGHTLVCALMDVASKNGGMRA